MSKVFTVTTVAYDSNGCAGINDSTQGGTGNAVLELIEDSKSAGVLRRVS